MTSPLRVAAEPSTGPASPAWGQKTRAPRQVSPERGVSPCAVSHPNIGGAGPELRAMCLCGGTIGSLRKRGNPKICSPTFLQPRREGRGICTTGGHGWWIGREANGPDDVREQLEMGADVIKIFATGGMLTPGVEPSSPQLTDLEIHAAADEASRAGHRVAAHAHAPAGI